VVGLLREYGIYLLGFPARVLVWILIAFFLGLIFSMLQWPSFWRRCFDKQHKKSVELRQNVAEERAKQSKHIAKVLLWATGIILLLLALFYLVGVLK
jgi:hypothetical protein